MYTGIISQDDGEFNDFDLVKAEPVLLVGLLLCEFFFGHHYLGAGDVRCRCGELGHGFCV